MRYKITVEYDGTDYVGWQKQPDQLDKSIEEIIENAVCKMTGERPKINASGRTDAGVHAVAQIADFEITKEFTPFRMMAGLNNHLSQTNIAVVNCEIVANDFNSRFDAKMRHYRYFIVNRKGVLALQKKRAWHVPVKIDIDKMRKSAKYLVGEHDFSSFRDAECQAKSPVKIINEIKISKNDDEIMFEINAKSFLHHMVRNIVGTMIWVGTGKISVEDVKIILDKKDRKSSGPNAPAHGLYLYKIDY